MQEYHLSTKQRLIISWSCLSSRLIFHKFLALKFVNWTDAKTSGYQRSHLRQTQTTRNDVFLSGAEPTVWLMTRFLPYSPTMSRELRPCETRPSSSLTRWSCQRGRNSSYDPWCKITKLFSFFIDSLLLIWR